MKIGQMRHNKIYLTKYFKRQHLHVYSYRPNIKFAKNECLKLFLSCLADYEVGWDKLLNIWRGIIGCLVKDCFRDYT